MIVRRSPRLSPNPDDFLLSRWLILEVAEHSWMPSLAIDGLSLCCYIPGCERNTLPHLLTVPILHHWNRHHLSVSTPYDIVRFPFFLHAFPYSQMLPSWSTKSHGTFSTIPGPSVLPAGTLFIDPNSVVNITEHVNNGTLSWTPPSEGRWTILRMGQTTTGQE